MSYKDLYFSRRISNSTGFGRRIWMLKLPRRAETPSETILLGSLVEKIAPLFDTSYPLPFSMTTPQVLLKRMSEEKSRLRFSPNESLVISQTVVGAVISVTAGSNLDVGIEASVPGIPVSIGVGISNSKLAKVSLSLNEGAEIQYLPTEYINRFAKLYSGNGNDAFPTISIDVEDHLFVDLVVLAKNYSLIYEYNETLSARVDAEISVLNAKLGSKLEFRKSSEYSVSVNVKDDVPYLLGFKTLDWDDLDS
jgi:hypothetical protein